MMATKEDEKKLHGEPQAPGDSSLPRRIPRLETASEMRGFPISANGTALGLGKAGDDRELLADDENVSAEEAERIERLLQQVDHDLGRLAPRASRQGARHSIEERAPATVISRTARTSEERAQRAATTSPGLRETASNRGVWKWVVLGCLLGALASIMIVARIGKDASSAPPAPASTPRTSVALAPVPSATPTTAGVPIPQVPDATPPPAFVMPASDRPPPHVPMPTAPGHRASSVPTASTASGASSPTTLPSAQPQDPVRDQLLAPFRPEAE